MSNDDSVVYDEETTLKMNNGWAYYKRRVPIVDTCAQQHDVKYVQDMPNPQMGDRAICDICGGTVMFTGVSWKHK